MQCQHFGTCGSCIIYETSYEEQIEDKRVEVSQLLEPFYTKNLEVFTSPQSHYRARSEFRIWHEKERCYYAMGNLEKNGKVNIVECPKVIAPIQKRMWRLLEEIHTVPDILKKKLFSIEFLASTTDECLITMIYHRKLDEAWEGEAKKLESLLSCKIMGRSRKQKVILSDDFVIEKLLIDEKNFLYKEYENGFTQPNPIVNIKMINWAIKQAKKVGYGDFLESYCGLGNFTLPLSFYFNKVLATEISKRSIYSALENCDLNAISNIKFIRLSSKEMSEALSGVRLFNRLREINIDDYHFSTVLVDPPRAGLDEDTMELISTIEYIIYISCNPYSLADDLKKLTLTHEVLEGAIFDQFPHTKHVESGVFLKKQASLPYHE